jgi:hypothetical protein
MNQFLRLGGESGEPPGRVYARFAQQEEDDEGNVLEIQFGAVDASWADAYAAEERPGRAYEKAPLSVVTMAEPVARQMGYAAPDDTAEAPDEWLELTFGATGPEVDQYLNLFAAPVKRPLTKVGRVPKKTGTLLSTITSLAGLPHATPAQLTTALALKRNPHAVAVYDVGQGNCNAVLDSGFLPLLYFDFGGGVLGHRGTFPTALKEFCFSAQPTIVLSHWDWDHWSSAGRDVRAERCTWIVPDQIVDPIHQAMATTINAHGTLLIWPPRTTSVVSGPLEIRKCTGTGRNHSGLALTVSDPSGHGDSILMTGDAHYTAIPGALGATYGGLVASHHGGRMTSSSVPKRSATSHERLAYSYGVPNSYGHVLTRTEANHRAGHWTPDLRTTSRSSADPAHIAIGWSTLTPGPPPCCGMGCQLEIQQT